MLTPTHITKYKHCFVTHNTNHNNAMSAPQTCLPGTYRTVFFTVELCVMCLPGWFNALENATHCQPCPVHTFAPDQGSTTCARCPYLTYTPTFGAKECVSCNDITANDSVALEGTDVCIPVVPQEVAYNNIVAVGIGMLVLIAFLLLLCRYYAMRKKIVHMYFCETMRRRSRDAAGYHNLHSDPTEQRVEQILSASQDVSGPESDDGQIDEDVLELEVHPPPAPTRPPLPKRSAVAT